MSDTSDETNQPAEARLKPFLVVDLPRGASLGVLQLVLAEGGKVEEATKLLSRSVAAVYEHLIKVASPRAPIEVAREMAIAKGTSRAALASLKRLRLVVEENGRYSVS